MVYKDKIKILFLIDCLYGFGGTEKHLFQLVTQLDGDKFECVVCPLRYNPEMVDTFRKTGISVIPIQLKRIYGVSALRYAVKLCQLLNKKKFDIVQSFNVDSDIFGVFVAKLAGTPIIISSRRDLGGYRKKHHVKLTKFTNRFVSHFIAVCDAVAKTFIEMEGVGWERITTVYNGIDLVNLAEIDSQKVLELSNNYNITPNSFVIGNVAHLRPEKGHKIFFEAISKVKPKIPELRVLAVGDGDTKSKLQNEINKNGIANNVFFTGYVENVFDYLSVMDICCLTPISNEGFSNALLEQMSMGKAIIATDVGGNREVIKDGKSGIIIPPNDVNALADAIMKLYKEAEFRNSIEQGAIKRVYEQFNLKKMISRMEQFYQNMYKKRTKSRNNSVELSSTLKTI